MWKRAPEGTGVTLTALCPGPTDTDFSPRATWNKRERFNSSSDGTSGRGPSDQRLRLAQKKGPRHRWRGPLPLQTGPGSSTLALVRRQIGARRPRRAIDAVMCPPGHEARRASKRTRALLPTRPSKRIAAPGAGSVLEVGKGPSMHPQPHRHSRTRSDRSHMTAQRLAADWRRLVCNNFHSRCCRRPRYSYTVDGRTFEFPWSSPGCAGRTDPDGRPSSSPMSVKTCRFFPNS